MSKFLDYAAQMYYEGTPVISDEEFDKLAERSNYISVGYAGGDIEHTYRMYSLQKKVVGDNIDSMLQGNVVWTPKLDGAAVSLTYVSGRLSLALTRGDGIKGKDITQKMKCLVPNKVVSRMSSVYMGRIAQITGEVVAKKDIPNARNYAAGSLNLKDIEEFKRRELKFIAYGVQPSLSDITWSQDMKWLRDFEHFSTVIDSDWREYPHDGKVARLDNVRLFNNMGHTAHHPKGAFALKEKQQGVITKLLDVVWQTGKSGIVSPVALLDPVIIGEATISRATLHNISYIRELGLEIGCQVEVIRSGEIIPRVVKRIN